jgi:hypothetical protein
MRTVSCCSLHFCPSRSAHRNVYRYHAEWRDIVKTIHNGTVDVSLADILMKPQDLTFADFIAPLVNVRSNITNRPWPPPFTSLPQHSRSFGTVFETVSLNKVWPRRLRHTIWGLAFGWFSSPSGVPFIAMIWFYHEPPTGIKSRLSLEMLDRVISSNSDANSSVKMAEN